MKRLIDPQLRALIKVGSRFKLGDVGVVHTNASDHTDTPSHRNLTPPHVGKDSMSLYQMMISRPVCIKCHISREFDRI